MKAATILATVFIGGVVVLGGENSPKPETTIAPLTMEWQSFMEMNDAFADRFVSKKGFGFSRMIDLERMKTITIAGKPYRIGKVQLIGITEHAKPVLYETHADANKDNFKKAKTRGLTIAETRALSTVRSGTQWVMTPKTANVNEGHRVMIGQLRARESCLKCHEGAKTGDLLGAFRYQIIPSISLLEKPPETKAPQLAPVLHIPHAG